MERYLGRGEKITEPLVARKTSAVSIANNLPDTFRKAVRFDIAIFCMEVEYSDMCQPGLFTRMGHFYFDGHFPCGWWGLFPDGKLIIY